MGLLGTLILIGPDLPLSLADVALYVVICSSPDVFVREWTL